MSITAPLHQDSFINFNWFWIMSKILKLIFHLPIGLFHQQIALQTRLEFAFYSNIVVLKQNERISK